MLNEMFDMAFWKAYVGTWVWALTALVLFFIFFKVADVVLPGCLKKDVEEKGNIAVAIIFGSAMIAFGLILAAAIH